ncbi:MAG: type II secretion system F family protein [Chthonomonadetes bacterium]|nr:type II secretion system F family protein [Chthonomonadetes bacterium]
MPVYRYTAKNQQGGTVTGLVEAEDTRRAAGIVREMGLLLLDVRPERTMDVGHAEQAVMQKVVYPVYSGVSVRDLAVFYRQVATAVRAGIPIHRALISVAENTGKPRLRRVVQAVVNDLMQGKTLAKAMRQHPHVFDELQIALIQAGEEGGLLDNMLERLADYLERDYRLRLKIRAGTFYPKVLLVAGIFIPKIPILVVGGGLIPYLRETVGWAGPILLAVLAVLAVFRIALQIEPVREAYDSLKLMVPGIGGLVRQLAMARFSRALAALFSAGVPLQRAISISALAADNAYLTKRLRTAVTAVEHGQSLSSAFRQTGVMPPLVLDMLSTGESTGSVDAMMDKVAEYYEQETDVKSHQAVIALSVGVYLLIALWIASMIIGFWQGYASGGGAFLGE